MTGAPEYRPLDHYVNDPHPGGDHFYERQMTCCIWKQEGVLAEGGGNAWDGQLVFHSSQL